MVAALKRKLEAHLGGILVIARLMPKPQGQGETPLSFQDYLHFMFAVMDPNFHFLWLSRGNEEEEDTMALREAEVSQRFFCLPSERERERGKDVTSPCLSSGEGWSDPRHCLLGP